ncbi:hypothetical protein N7519_006706 [Penicillium mononematosum]|uniref:uncharacterized protein n=1 Tax=Penicillium mononematosum TaxID=268346 RepID=UPI00254748DD|nr:uncharacterized protein N7519_006706 [Penicillium mononematosum]KAJ6185405.1 hypothetical protein N7519_006706 [Penicillium mononematosum]
MTASDVDTALIHPLTCFFALEDIPVDTEYLVHSPRFANVGPSNEYPTCATAMAQSRRSATN